MASDINSEQIDEKFPVAGKDNDSQGFRDNFDVIKTNFFEAKSEIEDLQNSVVRVDQNNDLNRNNIENANFVSTTENSVNKGTLNGVDTTALKLSFNEAHYFKINVGDDITLTFTDLPSGSGGTNTGVVAKMRLVLISSDDTEKTVFWASEPPSTFLKSEDWPEIDGKRKDGLKVSSSNEFVVVDFWSDNSDVAGVIFANFVGRFFT